MESHIAKYGWGDWGHGCGSGPDDGASCTPAAHVCIEGRCTFTKGNSSCWCQNVTYAEIGSYGPGASPSTRVKWAHVVSEREDHSARILGALGLAGSTPQSAMGLWVPPFGAPRPSSSTWEDPWLPGWAPTYNMSLSTIMQPCNYSGYMDLDFASKFGLVDIDWANALELWSNNRPMSAHLQHLKLSFKRPWAAARVMPASCRY
eukprot:SAG31_NODE_4852_length_2905_cov_3.033143_1_plen_204_part_00